MFSLTILLFGKIKWSRAEFGITDGTKKDEREKSTQTAKWLLTACVTEYRVSSERTGIEVGKEKAFVLLLSSFVLRFLYHHVIRRNCVTRCSIYFMTLHLIERRIIVWMLIDFPLPFPLMSVPSLAKRRDAWNMNHAFESLESGRKGGREHRARGRGLHHSNRYRKWWHRTRICIQTCDKLVTSRTGKWKENPGSVHKLTPRSNSCPLSGFWCSYQLRASAPLTSIDVAPNSVRHRYPDTRCSYHVSSSDPDGNPWSKRRQTKSKPLFPFSTSSSCRQGTRKQRKQRAPSQKELSGMGRKKGEKKSKAGNDRTKSSVK